MAHLDRMIESARRALVHVLELTASDRVLIVGDVQCQKCAKAFLEAVRSLGCATTTFDLPEPERPLKAMPKGLAEMIEDHDLVINVMAGPNEELAFRIEWLTLLEERGLRIAHSPSIHEDMMDGGPMDVDYALMADQANRLIEALNDAVSAQLTAPAGTDMRLDLRGRRFVTDVKITETERGANLPCGEVYCAPVEDGAEGLVVSDGSIGGLGTPPSPISLRVQSGHVTNVSCADPHWEQQITEVLDTDGGARTIAELGIGLNPKARLIGVMLEDEKALRTAHIAFGSNIGIPGGVNHSTTHVDYLILNPTLVARFEDGSTRTILDNGDLRV